MSVEDVVRHLPCCPGGIIEVEGRNAETGVCRKCGSTVRLVPRPRAAGIHETAIVGDGISVGANPSVDAYAIVGNKDGSPISIGANSRIGYHSIVRGNVTIGDNFTLGSMSSIEGTTTIGDDVTIRGKCEIPNSIIGNRVNIYAGVKFYDTPNPPDGPNVPPVIEDDVTICCDSAILGGVTIGKGSFIGARCFVTEDVPPNSFVTARSECRIRPRRS